MFAAAAIACGQDRDGGAPRDAGASAPPPTEGQGGAVADGAARLAGSEAVGAADTAAADARRWGVAAVRVDHVTAGVATLAEVRTATHAGFDRVVFEFEGALPGYTVEYAERPVIACGSGHGVPLPDGAPLVVRFNPARAHDGQGRVTVTERDRTLALPGLTTLQVFCDFEARLDWVATTRARTTFAVTEFEAPARLVIDVRHP